MLLAYPLNSEGRIQFGDGYTHLEGHSDDTGRFRIDGLAPGKWRFCVRASGFYAVVLERTLTSGQDDVIIDLGHRGEIQGRVWSRVTGDPLSRNAVSLSLQKAERDEAGQWRWWSGGRFAGLAWVRPDGRFRFRGLGPGRYRLSVSAVKHARWEHDFVLAAGEKTDGVEIALGRSRPGKVRLTVSVEGGKAVGRAFVFRVKGGLSTSVKTKCPETDIYETTLEAGTVDLLVKAWRAGGVLHTGTAAVEVREDQVVEAGVVLRPASETR